MRRKSVVSMVVVLSLVVAGTALAGRGTDYGEGLTGKKTVKIAKLLAEPDPFVGEVVRVRGVVTAVCEKRGCWMSLAAGKEHDDLRIKVDDGVIVFPLSAKGKRAIAEGVLAKIDLSLEATVRYLAHLAEERGEPFDPDSVSEPLTFYQVDATGARLF